MKKQPLKETLKRIGGGYLLNERYSVGEYPGVDQKKLLKAYKNVQKSFYKMKKDVENLGKELGSAETKEFKKIANIELFHIF